MNRSKRQAFFLAAGIVFTLAAIFYISLVIRAQLSSRHQAAIPEKVIVEFQGLEEAIQLATAQGAQTALQSSQTLTATIPPFVPIAPTASPIVTQTPLRIAMFTITPSSTSLPDWSFDGVRLQNEQLSLFVRMRCDPETIVPIPETMIIPWHSGIFDKAEFAIDEDTTIAWEHLGIYGLWMHSGWDYQGEESAATWLQYFLENDANYNVNTVQAIQQNISKCLLGSTVKLEQGTYSTTGIIRAAVRIPPVEVEEVSGHVMDLVPFLANRYPESGFDNFSAPGLVLYFCGRSAIDETDDPQSDYWTQSRFVIGLTPVD